MAYRIAGIDVHKRKLAVVVADIEVDDEYPFERRWYGSNPEQLQRLAEWFIEQQVEEVVMESTAQYWKPLWSSLERYWKPTCPNREGAGKMSGTLHLAQVGDREGYSGEVRRCADEANRQVHAPDAPQSPRSRAFSGTSHACSVLLEGYLRRGDRPRLRREKSR